MDKKYIYFLKIICKRIFPNRRTLFSYYCIKYTRILYGVCDGMKLKQLTQKRNIGTKHSQMTLVSNFSAKHQDVQPISWYADINIFFQTFIVTLWLA